MLAPLTEELLATIDNAVVELSDDLEVQENHRFWALFGSEYGFYRDEPKNRAAWIWDEKEPQRVFRHKDGTPVVRDDGSVVVFGRWVRHRRRMREREWIETHVLIKDKKSQLVRLVPNPAQRAFLALLYRMVRAGLPVRIIILKARQLGFSTFIQALLFQYALRRAHFRGLMVAHRKPTARTIFRKIHVMRKRVLRWDGGSWNFSTPHKSTEGLAFNAPMESALEVDSAEVDEPGHGDTLDALHMTETARWKDAATKTKGLEQTVPEIAGTYIFNESTARGDSGSFRDTFWRAFRPGESPREESEEGVTWAALFVPWFIDPEYRWTEMRHRDELPKKLLERIKSSLTKEEERLLGQRYFVRRDGWKQIDFDQLAWRRSFKKNKCEDSWDSFDEQYPGFPEDAFLASGRPAFDTRRVRDLMAKAQKPIWTGDAIEATPGLPAAETEADDDLLRAAYS